MTNELKKRDCDIKIKLRPSGSQYLSFEMDIQGDHLRFLPSSVVGEQFGAIISALYTLFCEDNDYHNDWYDRDPIVDDNNIVLTRVTKVEWDNEGDNIYIVLSRNPAYDVDYTKDQMDIQIQNYDKVLKHYTVNTRDLCYAVAKACTEVIKEYGFFGYRVSTEYDYFKLHQLLYIKSFALMNFEARELFTNNDNEWAKRSSFEKEIELLLFDM